MSKRLALLIATSRYLDPKLDPLLSVADEAQQLAQLLLEPAPTLQGFWQRAGFDTLTLQEMLA